MNESQGTLFPSGTALVIGGSGGIGSTICRELARAGSDVALTYHRNESRAAVVAQDIRDMGRSASIHAMSTHDDAQVRSVIEAVAAQAGRIHTIVFAAAAVTEQVYLSQIDRAQWQRALDEEVTGFYNVVQASLPLMKAAGGGNYVHLGSAGDVRWANRDALSIVPKAAIEAMVRGVAREEGRYGIRANSVLVGVIEAGMFLELRRQGVFDDAWIEATYRNQALKRLGRPEEIAHAVVFLASSKAEFVTGQQIAVAGGYGL